MARTIKVLRLSFLFALLLVAIGSLSARAASPKVVVLSVEGTIVPVVNDYINRGLTEAESQGASVCVIKLSTPGGVYDSTQKIVQRILNAKVPVVVFVTPSGAWAASAGTYITLAANVAAMTPGTRIGAATPVSLNDQQLSQEMQTKLTQDAQAFIRTISNQRGRDSAAAELAVSEGKSYTDAEALQSKLIDLQAADLPDLMNKINGRQVTLTSGLTVTIDTAGYTEQPAEMNAIEKFLQAISDPNVAYILLSLATIGIMVELYSPGLIFPGVIGGISLLLAFYSLGVLNAYWGGILLILLAYGFFVAELFVTSGGMLLAGGLISMVVGSLILFSGSTGIEVNRGLIAGTSIVIAVLLGLLLYAVVRGQKRKAVTGSDGMIGETAIVDTSLNPRGIVLVEGERWSAVLDEGSAAKDEEVKVTLVEGLVLHVTKKSGKEE
jgi:membrane-bound serine protease (ClpP class)